MYKCTECGLEFEIKPEYCDCGNDEFVLTVQESAANVDANQEEQNIVPKVDSVTENKPKMSESNQQIKNSYINSAERIYNNYNEQYKQPISPFAIFIFVICLLLSLLVIFAWKLTNEIAEQDIKTSEVNNVITIPSIDKLWKEPAPQETKTEAPKAQQQLEPVKKVTVVPLTRKTAQKKQISVSKPVTKQQNNVTTAASNKTQTKPAVNNTLSANKAQEDAKKAQEEAAKKALEAKKKAEAEALAAAEKAKKAAQAKQELYSYKINLRNAIGQKIDFTRVIGDGDCSVTFKLDANGRLINRAFAKQSSNITLNNAVYNAVMATPVFMQPPKAYNNETLKLNVSFANGNFAIYLE